MKLMRLIVLILLATMVFGAIVEQAPNARASAVFPARDDDGAEESDDDDGDDDDDDDDDEGRNKQEKKEKKDNKDKKEKAEKAPKVVPTPIYSVNVTCESLQDRQETNCTFAASVPLGARKVTHLLVSDAELCAPVIEAQAEVTNDVPGEQSDGYVSRGSEAAFSLVFSGTVSVVGETTYWVRSAGKLFPAQGPAIACERTDSGATRTPDSSQSTTLATATAISITLDQTPASGATEPSGAIDVEHYQCPEGSDPAEIDWLVACSAGLEGTEFSLSSVGSDEAMEVKGRTNADGQVEFATLPAGLYDLRPEGHVWCHAESDSVDEDGNLVVGASKVTVWIISCTGNPEK
jgi:hypothetical protein